MENDPAKRRITKRSGIGLAAALGAALGAAPAAADRALEADHGYSDHGSSYEGFAEDFRPNEEAVAVFSEVNAELNGKLSITRDQLQRMYDAITRFTIAHPAVEGTRVSTENGDALGASYDPLLELEFALMRGRDINPLVKGFGLDYINKLRTPKRLD